MFERLRQRLKPARGKFKQKSQMAKRPNLKPLSAEQLTNLRKKIEEGRKTPAMQRLLIKEKKAVPSVGGSLIAANIKLMDHNFKMLLAYYAKKKRIPFSEAVRKIVSLTKKIEYEASKQLTGKGYSSAYALVGCQAPPNLRLKVVDMQMRRYNKEMFKKGTPWVVDEKQFIARKPEFWLSYSQTERESRDLWKQGKRVAASARPAIATAYPSSSSFAILRELNEIETTGPWRSACKNDITTIVHEIDHLTNQNQKLVHNPERKKTPRRNRS